MRPPKVVVQILRTLLDAYGEEAIVEIIARLRLKEPSARRPMRKRPVPKASSRGRQNVPPPTAPSLREFRKELAAAETKDVLLELLSRYEAKTFLGTYQEIHAFLAAYKKCIPIHSNRKDRSRRRLRTHVFSILVKLPERRLERLINAPSPETSDLKIFAEEYLGPPNKSREE